MSEQVALRVLRQDAAPKAVPTIVSYGAAAAAVLGLLAWLVGTSEMLVVSVVGLGGGTIPSFLRKRLPELAIDVATPGDSARLAALLEDGELRAGAPLLPRAVRFTEPGGAPPRDLHDPAVLSLQADLLERLSAAAEEAA